MYETVQLNKHKIFPNFIENHSKMIQKIASIVNIRVWVKGKDQMKSRYYGRACINYFKSGQGRKISFVVQDKNGGRVTFDCPLVAMYKLIDLIKKDGPVNMRRNNEAWKLKMWDGNERP